MPPDAAPLLDAKGVDAGYGTMQVLWGVDLDVRPGETVLLLGANGAGKTTFLKSLVGLIDARHGQIKLGGEDITRMRSADRMKRGMTSSPTFPPCWLPHPQTAIARHGKRAGRALRRRPATTACRDGQSGRDGPGTVRVHFEQQRPGAERDFTRVGADLVDEEVREPAVVVADDGEVGLAVVGQRHRGQALGRWCDAKHVVGTLVKQLSGAGGGH